jgi:fatty acid-binding protein DegV
MVFLKNGGRISKAQYILGSLAKVKPIIAAYQGSITDEKHGIKALKGKGVMGASQKAMDTLFND